MRAIAVVLTFATATCGVGCGSEEPQRAPLREPAQPSPIASGTDVVGENPVAHAFAPWKTDKPQHFKLQITHTVQPHDVYWTGEFHGGSSGSGGPRRPLEVEAWVDSDEHAARSSGPLATLAHYAVGARKSTQLGAPPDFRSVPPFRVRGKPETASIPLLNPGPLEVGWAPDRPPSRLGDDLVRLFDLPAVAEWLSAVPAWSTSMAGAGTSHHAMARWPEGALTGWTVQVDVTVVVSAERRLERVEVALLRGRKPEPSLDHMAGWLDRPVPLPPQNWAPQARPTEGPWATEFPFPPLKLPKDVYEPSKLKGDPTIGVPAHEVTEFVLVPDPNPPSPELTAFLHGERAKR